MTAPAGHAPALTPVRITGRYPTGRSRRAQAWAAVSADGEWAYRRTEEPGTPWEVRHQPTGTWCGFFPSLPAARRATADGTALTLAPAA